MELTTTDWSHDVREWFKETHDGDTFYPYDSGHCWLVRIIVEPVAIALAREGDWLTLDDCADLTGFTLTTKVAVLQLLNELHPKHPEVLDENHCSRRVAAQHGLQQQILNSMDQCPDASQMIPDPRHAVQHWATP